jgi:hypothetical protein
LPVVTKRGQRKPAGLIGDALLRNKARSLDAARPLTTEQSYVFDFTVERIPAALLNAKATILSGKTNIGKTCYAMAHGQRPYLIKTTDHLGRIPSGCDLLVFRRYELWRRLRLRAHHGGDYLPAHCPTAGLHPVPLQRRHPALHPTHLHHQPQPTETRGRMRLSLGAAPAPSTTRSHSTPPERGARRPAYSN